MTSVVSALVVGVITYLGRVSRGKNMDISLVVGIGGLAVVFALLEEADEGLAKKFELLVILGVLLAHWQVIVKAAGFSNSGVTNKFTVNDKTTGIKYTDKGINITTPSRVGGQ